MPSQRNIWMTLLKQNKKTSNQVESFEYDSVRIFVYTF